MPSQSRAFEASFEPSDKPAAPLGTDPGPMLEDFDSFFEKLNKLEPTEWRKPTSTGAETSAASLAAGKAFASPAAKKAIDPNTTSTIAAKTAAKVAAKSAMGDPLAGLRAAFAHAKKTQQAESHHGRGRLGREVPGAFRFALTALVLFAVGMGIGWAVLSLPGKGGDASTASEPVTAPEKSLIVESKLDTLLAKPQDKTDTLAPLPLTETAPGAVVTVAKPEKPDMSVKADPNSAMPVDLAAARMVNGIDNKAADLKASDTKPDENGTLAMQVPVATPTAAVKSEVKSKPAKAVASTSKVVVPAAPVIPSTGSDASISGEGRYAVQVGACRSTRCVENYRKLISAHLTTQADRIRVFSVASDGRDTGVQRVRVAPLDKAAAQQLRAALIQADPRLSEAYVVEFHQ